MTDKHADAFDMEAEQSVLSFMLNNPTWVGSLGIRPTDFHEVYHRQIASDLYAGLSQRRPPDGYEIDGAKYIEDLRDSPPTLEVVRNLVRHLKHLAIERGKAKPSRPPVLRLVD